MQTDQARWLGLLMDEKLRHLAWARFQRSKIAINAGVALRRKPRNSLVNATSSAGSSMRLSALWKTDSRSRRRPRGDGLRHAPPVGAPTCLNVCSSMSVASIEDGCLTDHTFQHVHACMLNNPMPACLPPCLNARVLPAVCKSQARRPRCTQVRSEEYEAQAPCTRVALEGVWGCYILCTKKHIISHLLSNSM